MPERGWFSLIKKKSRARSFGSGARLCPFLPHGKAEPYVICPPSINRKSDRNQAGKGNFGVDEESESGTRLSTDQFCPHGSAPFDSAHRALFLWTTLPPLGWSAPIRSGPDVTSIYR